MTRFVKIKIALTGLFMFISSLSVAAQKDVTAQKDVEIDYCNTIKFRIGSFNRKKIQSASDKGDCRQYPIPLELNYGGSKINAKIDMWRETFAHVALPFKKDPETNKFVPDEDELDLELKKWPQYKALHLDSMTYRTEFLYVEKSTGTTIISKIRFTKRDGSPGPMIAHYSFYKQDGYAASYTSGFVSPGNRNALAMMEAVKTLFLSMTIDW